MKFRKLATNFACVISLAFPCFVHAAFIDAGGGMVYDTDLDVTWLQDANYAMTSGYDADGLMNWVNSVAWASSLNVGGATGWRLPTMTTSGGPRPNGNGQSVTGPTKSNEFGWLWHRLNGGADITASTDISPFINLPLQNSGPGQYFQEWYWTAEETANNAWRMSMNCACWDSGSDKLTSEWYAWAVHDGNIAGVPEPPTLWLLATCLLGFGIAGRKTSHFFNP